MLKLIRSNPNEGHRTFSEHDSRSYTSRGDIYYIRQDIKNDVHFSISYVNSYVYLKISYVYLMCISGKVRCTS